MGRTPKLEDVIEAGIEQRLNEFYTCLPVRVVSYNAAVQQVKVKSVTAAPAEDGAGKKTWYRPAIGGVPVMFTGGTGPTGEIYRITHPISAGDFGIYIVSSLRYQSWLYDKNGKDVELKHTTQNDIGDGFFIPGLSSGLGPTKQPDTNALVIHGDNIKLGGPTGTSPVATEATMTAFMTALTSAISALGGPSSPSAAELVALESALTTANWPSVHTASNTEAK